jgi:hypothetical protein
VWRKLTDAEKDALYDYTVSYSKFNEPLRGIEYGTSRYLGVGNTDLNAGYKNNGDALNAMTEAINKSGMKEDVWLQRGCRQGGMDKFFGCDMNLLDRGTQKELREELLGKEVTEYGFMSCGSCKGKGFAGSPIILNVYAPKGTKGFYVEPISGFGNGAGRNWNGIDKQSSFGTELETILQQGTKMRITKVERRGKTGTIFMDLEIIDQSTQQRWKKPLRGRQNVI